MIESMFHQNGMEKINIEYECALIYKSLKSRLSDCYVYHEGVAGWSAPPGLGECICKLERQ